MSNVAISGFKFFTFIFSSFQCLGSLFYEISRLDKSLMILVFGNKSGRGKIFRDRRLRFVAVEKGKISDV